MKKSFKKIAASLVAATMLVTGMTGVVSSATDVSEEPTSVTSEDVTRSIKYSYRFNVSSQPGGPNGGEASGGALTLASAARIDISFGAVTSGCQALVTVHSTSYPNDTYGDFIMPTYAGATLHRYIDLPRGSYYFYVTPYGGNHTEGSFTVTVM